MAGDERDDEKARFYAEVFEHAEIGLSAWQLDASTEPPQLRLVAMNAALARILDLAPDLGPGASVSELMPSLAETGMLDKAREIATTGGVAKLATFRRADPRGTTVLSATLFGLPNGRVGMSVEDTTRQAHAEALFAAERKALELLAAGAPLPEILTTIVTAIETQSVGGIASILLLDETGTHLRNGAAPGLPDAYNRAIEGMPIGPRAGSCGTSMYRREPVVVSDIETDPLWDDYRELARAHGLRACWSYPILASDGRALGSFALYHRTPRSPSLRGAEGLQRAAHITGMAIERRMLDDQLRALAARIEAAREDERTKIAHDVHDQLGQAVTALKLDIGWLQRRISDAALAQRLDDMSTSTDDVLQIVRRISADLRPGILDALGLRAAIEWQAEEFERRTGTRCAVASGGADVHLDRDLSTAVFRIFQEALTNVARHANAKHVWVRMFLERGSLRLDVADDGIGVPDLGPPATTLGILGMRERARRLGGDCTVKRRSPHGTMVSVTVPLRFPAERASG